MGDPEDKDDKHADDLARLPSLFKEWQGLVVVLGGAVAAVLAVLLPGQTPAAVQVIGYTVAVALVVVGALIFVKVRRRQRSRQLREKRREKWEREAGGAHRTAFRGLFPYQEGDELPGEHRQLEARRLVTQFSEPTFSFGVVCGDSGCGKTSLLRSAIQSRLKAAGEDRGFGVLYLSSPRELSDDRQHAGAEDSAARLRRELEKLRQLAEGTARGRSLILIIDQFEEFFIEYGGPELRLEIGRFLNGLIRSSPPVRILCAIRRDYLADMKDLAPQTPDAADRNFFEPFSFKSVFKLNNFTVEQAARVVGECAERDRVEVEEEFAAMLASDLGEGGFVRPPELQIVCTALVGNLTTAEYRLAGGARGILSHYIEDAIDVSGDPAVGRRVLRALCDFPAHAKRNPQTVADIAAVIGAEGAQASALVRTALRQFEVARLVSPEKRGKDKPAYALVHDYLVDAVSKATSDVSTRDEEANQLLDYYVAEYRDDPKTRIPYRRLRFVRKYADPKKLADPTARRLLRACTTRLVTSTAALAALVLAATTLLVGLITTRSVWHQEVLGSHWAAGDFGRVVWDVLPKHGLILSRASEGKGDHDVVDSWDTYVRMWDVRTARTVNSINRDSFTYAPPDYIVGYEKKEDAPFITAFHIPTGRVFQTAIPKQLAEGMLGVSNHGLVISASGKTVAIRGGSYSHSPGYEGRTLQPSVGVFSVADDKVKKEVETCDTSSYIYGYVTDDGEYYIEQCLEAGAIKPTAFNTSTKERRVLLRDGYRSAGLVAFDERSSRVASLEYSGDGRSYLILWDLRTGRILDQSDVALTISGGRANAGVSFTPDGEFLLVISPWGPSTYTRSSTHPLNDPDYTMRLTLTLFRTDGLRRVQAVPASGVKAIPLDNQDGRANNHLVLGWTDDSGETYLWDLIEEKPRLMDGLDIPSDVRNVLKMAFNAAGARVVSISREDAEVELWDFKTGEKLRQLDVPGRFNDVGFTIGGNAVSVSVEGGKVSLFHAEDGEKITDDVPNIGGTRRAIYYDEKCRWMHMWTDEGRVLRYTEGWYLFGREEWFWPTVKCEAR